MANSKKITLKSEQILATKLEQDLELAFVSVDSKNQKKVSFEQVGRILFLLNVFDVVRFDENCRGKSTGSSLIS